MTAAFTQSSAEPFATPLTTDVLIVGGGIAGCATAYYLAREGLEVTLIERDDISSQASGANAGSIHMQMSYLFATRDPAWIATYAPLLPILKTAILTWLELAREIDADIELTTNGGIMIAETEEQFEVLKRKVEIENRHQIESRIIDRDELLRLAPYVTPTAIGGEFCPLEGKSNPLVATFAIRRMAERAGARVLPFTELAGLEEQNGKWSARTSRGVIQAARVVIAAGGWCGSVASLAGFKLPVAGRPIHMNVTEPTEPMVNHLIYAAGLALTFKQGKTGQLIVGGGWPAALDPRSGRPVSVRSTVQQNLWTALRFVPGLAHLRLLRTWAGMVNETPDGRPVIGPVPGKKGLFVNTFPGRGYTGGPYSGKIITAMLQGKTLPIDPAFVGIDRFATVS
ncbi:MAG: FAD-binding oxidoreductase [Rhodospirillales bacterium]|nr:FAD-binding oxidoreductase [Rhodospirillales bacterium]